MPTSKEVAALLINRGYAPVPIARGTKGPRNPGWQNSNYGLSDLDKLWSENTGVGVILGREVKPKQFLMAVDIDFLEDPIITDRVWKALGGGSIPAKKGMKGATFFVKSSVLEIREKEKNYKRTFEPKGGIDMLGTTQQTVLPPSVHPITNTEYIWLEEYGPPLCDTEIDDVPEINQYMIDEIKLAVVSPDSPIFNIDSMVWNGPSGGGDVHQSVLRASGVMVTMSWSMEYILQRIFQSVNRMLQTNKHASKWDWKKFEYELRTNVSDALKKGFDKGNKAGSKKASRIQMQNDAVDALIAEFGGKENLGTIDGLFRTYEDGWWKERTMDEMMRRFTQDKENWEWVTANEAKQISMKLMLAAEVKIREPHNLVMTNKGTVNLMTGEIVENDPSYFITYVLPIDYDPDALCPMYDQFITDLFTAKSVKDKDIRAAINCFEEFCGLTFVNDTSFQKCLVILGPPAGGKSTMLKVVEQMHDISARVNPDLYNLTDDRVVASLVGRMISLTPEIGQDAFVPADTLKKIVDGSTISTRRLYAERFDSPMTARIIIACNDMFKYRDSSGAMERRLILLKTRPQIDEKDQVRGLLYDLLLEVPGIFNRFVRGLRNLRLRGHFVHPSYMKDAIDKASESSDPILRWMHDRTYEGMVQVDEEYEPPKGVDLTKGTSAQELYSDYKEWSEMNGHKLMSEITWGSRLSLRGLDPFNIRFPSGVQRYRKLTLTKRGNY